MDTMGTGFYLTEGTCDAAGKVCTETGNNPSKNERERLEKAALASVKYPGGWCAPIPVSSGPSVPASFSNGSPATLWQEWHPRST